MGIFFQMLTPFLLSNLPNHPLFVHRFISLQYFQPILRFCGSCGHNIERAHHFSSSEIADHELKG